MCRMLAKASSTESPSFELLDAPHSLLNQSMRACLPEIVEPTGFGSHNDGSGVAWLGKDGRIELAKRGKDDCWNESFQGLVRSMDTTALIAHNRRASPGLDVNMNVSHPYIIEYRGETIAFCHNGGISEFMEEARDRQTSDSFVFLERLTQRMGALTMYELKTALAKSADTLNFSSISAMLLTKDSVFAWRCYNEDPQSTWNRSRYYSLYVREGDGHICVASEPVTNDNAWVSIENRTLVHIPLTGAALRHEQVAF